MKNSKSNLKIDIYSFGATEGILLDIYYFFKSKKIDLSFNVSKHIKSKTINYKSYNLCFWISHRIVFKILKKIRIPYFWIRHLQENIYDIYFSRTIKKGCVIITTNGWMPKVLERNSKFDGLNILLAGNPCDLKISKVLEDERDKSINIKDIYNFKPRLYNYEKTLQYSDYVITFNSLCNNSFSQYVSNEKLIPINSTFPLKTGLFKKKNIIKNKTFTFCYIGHTILLKGLHILLDAWGKIDTTDVQLIIGGTIQNELTPFIMGKMGKFKNVIYYGKVIDLNKFYRSSHVYICPSIIDAGPMTILESMYCELPLIVSENCGYKYLISNDNIGLVYKNNSSAELSKSIDWFIKNKEKAIEMGKKANTHLLLQLSKNVDINEVLIKLIQKQQ